MQRRHLRIYVRTARKAAGLSQAELGELIGYHEDSIRRYEQGQRRPPLKFILACSFVFGQNLGELFPTLNRAIQDDIGIRAGRLDKRWRNLADPASRKKLALLHAIAGRMDAIDV